MYAVGMTNTTAPALTVLHTGRSIFGSGVETTTYRDAEGNEWLSIGGRAPELTKTAAELERRARIHELARQARAAADAGDLDLAAELLEAATAA